MRIEPAIAMEDLPECVLEAGKGKPIGPMTVNQYLRRPETNQRESLVYGWLVREPGPTGAHQITIMQLIVALQIYVTDRALGIVIHSPCDVVLDEAKRLMVQPDVMVVFNDRLRWRKGRLRVAPNVAIEVLSPKTATRDRTIKLEWYRTYGTMEYWIVDVRQKQIDVISLVAEPEPVVRTYRDGDVLRSWVLQDFRCRISEVFEPAYKYVYAHDSSENGEEAQRYARKVPRRKR